MKKILCALVLMCMIVSCAWAEVAIDEAHFPDEIFRTYVSENLDGDSDGVLSDSEIADITTVNVNSMGISDITGIKNFTYLEVLRCSNNGLTQLDINNMQSLQAVYCSYNSLESLNVSGCRNLKLLQCDNNSLKSLSISGCSYLTHLYCYRNELDGLDVSSNTALMYLRCQGNNIAVLNVRNNTALKRLYCSSNSLSELELTNNKALQDLSCGYNAMKALDLSNNTALTSVNVSSQSIGSLKVNRREDGTYYVDLMSDYGLTSQNLARVATSGVKGFNTKNNNVLTAYDSASGIASFSESPVKFLYGYDTGAGYSMDVTITAVPVITTEAPDDAYANRKYSFLFNAAGSGILRWAIDDESKLPEGMSFYPSTGRISGTPKAEGKYTFSLTVTGSAGSDTKTFTLEVKPSSESPESPVILTTDSDIPEGYVNARYSFKFGASVSSGLTWRIESGDVPGLSMTTSGTLSGTPTQAGSFKIDVNVQDRFGGFDEQTFTVSIKPSSEIEGRPVILTTQSEIPDAYERTKYSFKFTASGQYSSRWSIVSGDVPGLGLSLNGTLSGTPERAGVFAFRVQALMTARGGTDEKDFTLTVKAATETPVTPTPNPSPTPTPSNPSTGSSGGGGGCEASGGMMAVIGLYVVHGLRIRRKM